MYCTIYGKTIYVKKYVFTIDCVHCIAILVHKKKCNLLYKQNRVTPLHHKGVLWSLNDKLKRCPVLEGWLCVFFSRIFFNERCNFCIYSAIVELKCTGIM